MAGQAIAEASGVRLCSFPGCGRKCKCRGYCSTHYDQLIQGQDLRPIRGKKVTPDGVLCPSCSQRKPQSEFHTDRSRSSGLANYCKECSRAKDSERRRRRLYGLSDADIRRMLRAQGGKCPCGFALSLDEGFHVDHDHACCPGGKTCGKCVRFITHPPCNLIMGQAKDRPEVLRNLAIALEQSKAT